MPISRTSPSTPGWSFGRSHSLDADSSLSLALYLTTARGSTLSLHNPHDVSRDLAAAAAGHGEVVARAHLGEARDGAVELERLVAGLGPVEVLRLGVGRDDELDAALVEHVDERDEALRLVAALGGDHRHALEQDGVVRARQRQVVRGAERAPAEIVEGEPGDAHRLRR